MKLGIFGGSFDPIHLGHIKIATAAYSQFALDKVIFSPLNSTWDKKENPKASPENRVKMCRIAIEKYDFFEISCADIERGGITRSINTVNDIITDNKNNCFIYLIIGEDSAYQINQWNQSKDLLLKAQIIVAPREVKKRGIINESFNLIDIDKIGISSSTIRENIKKNKNWEKYVDPKVFKYIIKNKVYK